MLQKSDMDDNLGKNREAVFTQVAIHIAFL
jgi:hypothetical protein